MKKLHILGLIFAILSLLFVPIVRAIQTVPTNYSNSITGRLASQITATQTTGITVTADTYRTPAGKTYVTFPTGQMILKLSRTIGNTMQIEYIAVESASQSAETVTLGTTTRYLSSSDGSSFASQGDGLAFPSGTIVEMVWSVHQAEGVMYRGSKNTLTGSGYLTGSATTLEQALVRFPPMTTTQISALSASDGDFVYDSTLAVFKQRKGGAWETVGDTGTVNAGYATAGKIELATSQETLAGTASGSTNAALVVANKDVVVESTGRSMSGRVVALSGSGILDDSLIPTTTFGNGADGALSVTSGITTIDCAGMAFCEKNYTSISIAASTVLSIINGHSSGTILVLRSLGNVNIAGTINLAGSGGIGGAARTTNATVQEGLKSSRITNAISRIEQAGGGRGANGGGQGGSNGIAKGQAGVAGTQGAGGSGGTFYLTGALVTNFAVTPGAGGGGGASTDDAGAGTTTSSAGGRGGGGLYIGVGGNLTMTGTINLSGNNGVAGSISTGGYGGGGGGAGGIGLIRVKGSMDYMSATFTVTGGTGHAGNANDGGTPGAGGRGAYGNVSVTKSY